MKNDKQTRYRAKCIANGLCPHCGKPPAPGYKQCEYRIGIKKLNRILNDGCKKGLFKKVSRGIFAGENYKPENI